MKIRKKQKNKKTISLYPTCSIKNKQKIYEIYDMYEFLLKKEENTLEEIQKYNQELYNIELILPFLEEKYIHNDIVYAPYPQNEIIKNILSNYEIY